MAMPGGHPRAPIPFRDLRAYSEDILRAAAGVGDSSASVVTSRMVSFGAAATASSAASVVARVVFVDPARTFPVGPDARRVAVGQDARELGVSAEDRTVT